MVDTGSIDTGIATVRPDANARRAHFVAICGGLTAVLVVFGYLTRNERDLVASEGLGYALGIVGMAAMVALLLYSARKRMTALRAAAPLRLWFEVHMALGLLGPLAILYHANFRLGSPNGRVALFSMLLVSGSGIAGRFIYTRIHHGLLGQRATAVGMRRAMDERRRLLGNLIAESKEVSRELDRFEHGALEAPGGVFAAIGEFVMLGHRRRRTYRKILRIVRRDFSAQLVGQVRGDLRDYLGSVTKAGQLRGYQMLFSTWHALHLPLCFLLFGCAAIHIVAVHAY